MSVTPLPPAAGPIVDADGHVVEPPAAWAGLADAHRPRIHRDASGYEHVVVGDTEILAVPLGNLARPGSTFDDPATFRPLADAHPGGADPRSRLADMDAEGIDQAVLYPSIGLYAWAIPEPPAAVALARAYNDWLAGYCAASPQRLFGAALLPLQDPVAAAAELRRAVDQLGCRAGFVRPNPCLGRSLCDPAYEPVWTAAEELGVPIGIHEGSSVIVPTLGADRPFNPLILHAVSHSFEMMLACAQLITFGVLERHPGLHCIFLESSGGWAPFWLERLDEQAESFGGFCPDLKLTPSEYFARQCAISFEVDEQTLPALAPFVGERRIVWGSDYPHHDATFPGAVDAIRHTVAPCATATQLRVLGLNARQLYRLPSHLSGAAAVLADYFTAVTAQDLELLADLFAPDAELHSGQTHLVGREAVLGYYRDNTFTFEDFRPVPGPLDIAGGRVTVDIDVRMGGQDRAVHDIFELAGDRIAALHITGFDDARRPRRRALAERRRLRPAQQAARELAGRLVVLAHHRTRLHRGQVTPGALDEALARRRQVVDHLGRLESQAFVVDDIDVRQVAGSNEAAVVEAVERGRATGLQVDHLLDRELLAAVPVTGPVRQHERGQAGVAQHAAVGTAVAQAQHGGRMHQHLAHGVEVAGRVVEQREVEQLAPVALEHQVVEDLVGAPALPGGQRRHALLGCGLVVGRVAQREQLVHLGPQQRDEAAGCRAARPAWPGAPRRS